MKGLVIFLILIMGFGIVSFSNLAYADHATTYNEHWDSLCYYDYDRKLRNVEPPQYREDKDWLKIHQDILQKCLDWYTPIIGNEAVPDDDIIHPTCNMSCLPKNYEFGSNRIQDKDTLVCFDKYWSDRYQISRQCSDLHQEGEDMKMKYNELKQIWSEKYNEHTPDHYPTHPYFEEFTDEDMFCLLKADDYKNCLADHGPLENMKSDKRWATNVLYQGCFNQARNLIMSGEMTRAEASYVFNVCEVFVVYIMEERSSVPIVQPTEVSLESELDKAVPSIAEIGVVSEPESLDMKESNDNFFSGIQKFFESLFSWF